MKNKIIKVSPGSLAEEMDIEIGDRLISINGTEVKDIIDYKFLMAEEEIIMEIEKPNGDIWDIEVEKAYEEDLGVEFESSILDTARSCCNNCIFCFVDQLPKGMRETLYFKDDDSRLSFLQGNFVTLTNMKDEDIDRIIRYRISPINISVHTTNPELRVKMLNNRFAGDINNILKRLAAANIDMNCQIVLCPNINNGKELVSTVEDLYKFYPFIKNVAVVPVGVTKFRDGLFNVTLFNKDKSLKEIEGILPLQKRYINKIGSPFVRLSDEFYVMAEKEVPETAFYGSFDQLEDGIGMIRIFKENIKSTINELTKTKKGSFSLITGSSAHNELSLAASLINNYNKKISIEAIKIKNFFFGETITVAGLLTATDIIRQTSNLLLGDYVVIPHNMLRSGEEIFLDDITTEELSKILNRKIILCKYTGEDLIEIINEYSKED